jgi:hypothetical protein
MEFDSDSLLKWFGIAILVLAVGYLLFRVGKIVWGSIGTFRKVYQVSLAPPRLPDLAARFADTRQRATVRAARSSPPKA